MQWQHQASNQIIRQMKLSIIGTPEHSPKSALESSVSKKRNYETAIVLEDTDTDTEEGDGDGETDTDDDRSEQDDDERVSQHTSIDFEFERDWALSFKQERTPVKEFEREPGKWYLSSVQIPPFIPRPKVAQPVVNIVVSDTEPDQEDAEEDEFIEVDDTFVADHPKWSATAGLHPIPPVQSLSISWMAANADHEEHRDI
ncbi:hypothetical protein BGZ95_000551 [Linnemannia exigua]|uniref:Uncharacterized protein n=1 Tax=Linnemannia exigua TaxID=604196 RepID=A0AAD4DJA7_9FUNG|nr:hypothetical protein BGZ95_000551 [Linnemannia exigua]